MHLSLVIHSFSTLRTIPSLFSTFSTEYTIWLSNNSSLLFSVLTSAYQSPHALAVLGICMCALLRGTLSAAGRRRTPPTSIAVMQRQFDRLLGNHPVEGEGAPYSRSPFFLTSMLTESSEWAL